MSATTPSPQFIHASALVIGEWGVLLRGAAGAGKSSLAQFLIDAGAQAGHFARLIGDDRIGLVRCGDWLIASAHPHIAGRIEFRGIGIRQVPHFPRAVLGLVIDLLPEPPARLPLPEESRTVILGATLPRLAAPARPDAAIRAGLLREALCQFKARTPPRERGESSTAAPIFAPKSMAD